MPTQRPPWPQGVIESLSAVLAETEWPGLTGSEIASLLGSLGIEDVWPSVTKRKRLAAALANRQAQDGSSHRLLTFVVRVMDPSRYIVDPGRFHALQGQVNEVLSMTGLRINDSGQMALAPQARTLDEVARLTGRLRSELVRRGVHEQVLKYCEQELIQHSIFHAVFEATKGLFERLRQLSGSTLDGAELINFCFTKASPAIRINNNVTQSEMSEQSGFGNLLRGVSGTFRNPTAHAPRAHWPISEADALDLFSTLSYLHRRLDGAVTVKRT